MSLCETYFGKTIDNLQWEDIETFFQTEHEETDQIEFKSGKFSNEKELKEKLTKNVSAFLNSQGGIYIVGTPEAQKRDKAEFYQGELIPLNFSLNKDAIVTAIRDKIEPMPSGYKVKTLEKESKQLLIVETEQSPYSPHMVKGDKYYMRLDGQSLTAPHHYIEALMKKVSYPNLNMQVMGIKLEMSKENYEISLLISTSNDSLINALNPSIVILCPMLHGLKYDVYNELFGKRKLNDKTILNRKKFSILPKGISSNIRYHVEINKGSLYKDKYILMTLNLFAENAPLKEYLAILEVNEPIEVNVIHFEYNNKEMSKQDYREKIKKIISDNQHKS